MNDIKKLESDIKQSIILAFRSGMRTGEMAFTLYKSSTRQDFNKLSADLPGCREDHYLYMICYLQIKKELGNAAIDPAKELYFANRHTELLFDLLEQDLSESDLQQMIENIITKTN